MKQFFKFMFASMLGTFVAAFALFFVFFIIIAGALSTAFSDLDKSQRVTSVKDNSVLHFNLNRPIVDRGPEQTFNFDFGPFRSSSPIGLDQIIENLEKAKTDDKIEGILMDVSRPMAGMASLEEIRNALIDFKSSEKWIVAYGETFSQAGYYLASVSDEVYLYPEGEVDFKGLNTTIPFLKGMFEKLDIEMQVIRGSNNIFKSAVEPFMLDQMSQANRLQTETWLNSIWGNMLGGISQSKGIHSDTLRLTADQLRLQSAEDAVNQGFITALKYEDQVRDILKTKTETAADEELNLVSLTNYFRAPKQSDGKKVTSSFRKSKIAVIYATGEIGSGKGGEDAIGSETVAKAIKEAREDSTVKAIVFRINSPGGSALASDVIWRETSLAKAAKPFVVSMGDVAASGGYYIAADAHKIYAMPNTITGSIGVFGVIPNMKGLFKNKMGITFDGVKTGKYADIGDVTRPLSDQEYEIIQKSVDKIYAHFTQIVADGRNISVTYVDSIGQGRVWSGVDALRIGLVDELGGLEDAIAGAAKLAELENYAIKTLPKREDPFQSFMKELTGETSNMLLRWQFGGDEAIVRQFKQLQKAKEMHGIQAIIPYAIEVW